MPSKTQSASKERNVRSRPIALLLTALIAASAQGDDERPSPVPPSSASPSASENDTPADVATNTDAEPATEAPVNEADKEEAQEPSSDPKDAEYLQVDMRTSRSMNGRRDVPEGMVPLTFNAATVEETLPFIAEITGKIVIPLDQKTTLKNATITIMNDKPVPANEALDLIFNAFKLQNVAVIEREDVIIIGTLSKINEQLGSIPVIPASESIMGRLDRGSIVLKVFAVKQSPAEAIVEQFEEIRPQYATISVDETSNQIVVLGDIGLCQQVQEVINELDQLWVNTEIRTFRLKHADAESVSENIADLFEESSTNRSSSSNRGSSSRGNTSRSNSGNARSVSGLDVELRVAVNVQQNTVTISSAPEIVAKIAELIKTQWDLPRPKGTQRLYVLKYADPIEVRDILNNVLDQSSGGGGGGGGGGQGNQNSLTSLSGIYRFEAFPDKNALLVVCKTEESFAFLDSIIEEIDQPAAAGLPFVIELENADAVRLAEELNVLLAERGSGSGLSRPDEGLSGQPADTELEQAGTGREATEGGEITFPWQSGGRQNADNADQSPESSLIGKVRIVPIIRRNALSVLCPASLEQPIRDLVMAFDQPSRQVMITATIVEVRLGDDFALGVRIGNDDIASSSLADNRVAGGVTGAFNMAEFLGGVFSTSTLDIGTSVNVVIQALAELTDIRILQEPRIFTSDNEEAVFFDGKDVPTLTDTQLLETGVQNQSYEYRSVGVQLNVRPRITSVGDVDLEINLTLADLSTEKEFGASIINRRQTTSQVIVENRQTVVISGIITELESETNRKIPLLGDIPFIGELFNSNEDIKERKELLAFITPTVVHSPSDNYDNYNKIFLERLELLSRPLDAAFKDQMKEARFGEISPYENSQVPITERQLRHLEQEGVIDLDEPDLPLPPVIPNDQDSSSKTKPETTTERGLDQDDWEDLLEPTKESSSGE